jgi:hypothetical protein
MLADRSNQPRRFQDFHSLLDCQRIPAERPRDDRWIEFAALDGGDQKQVVIFTAELSQFLLDEVPDVLREFLFD